MMQPRNYENLGRRKTMYEIRDPRCRLEENPAERTAFRNNRLENQENTYLFPIE